MKNNFTPILFILLIIFIAPPAGKSQFIDNRIDLSAGYITGIFHGDELVEDGDFQYPSLYCNYKSCRGVSVEGLYKSYPFLSFGMGIDWSSSSGWELESQSEYMDATTMLFSVAPAVQLHTLLNKDGFFNRCKLFVELAPVVGWSNTTLENALFDIGEPGTIPVQPMKSNDFYYGIKGSAGFGVSLSQFTGFLFSYSFQYNRMNPELYCDTHISLSQFQIGLYLKVRRDKYYLFR